LTTKTAADRVAALRDEYARLGENVDHLSDLDLLNQHAERCERERIDINDRYMRLLTEQSKHEESVRAGAVSQLHGRLDILATEAVQRMAHNLTRILAAVDVLPERANAERVARLKQIAADTRHMLSLMGDQHPTQMWKLDDNRELVHAARTVVGVLGSRDGIPADEVIRLVGEALTANGNLHDLFKVADSGTPKSHLQRRQPSFVGENWAEMGGGSYYTYEPDGTPFRVVTYALGDTWWVDLQGPTGALIAAGEAEQETEVAGVAAALIEQAPTLAKSGLRPWQCWKHATSHPVRQAAPKAA
jgi:hypothetical protein